MTRRRRDLWLTSVLGLALLVGLPVVAVTGLLSNVAYDPRLGTNVLAQGRNLGPLDFYLFTWPSTPSWLYAFTQGLHVSLGLAILPIVLVKLWSILPGLFNPPGRTTIAYTLERLTLIVLVGAFLFVSFTGIFDILYFFPFNSQLVVAHYYGAWILIAAFLLHAALKLPTARRSLRLRRELLSPDRQLAQSPAAGSLPEQKAVSPGPHHSSLEQGLSRRALLGTAAAGSLILLVQGVAQAVGGPVRVLGFLAPRGDSTGSGPNDFQINGTAADAGITSKDIASSWTLRLLSEHGASRRLSREQLLALPQYSYSLPIACREGWSTTQHWTGVRLRDLAALIGEHGRPLMNMVALDGATATLAGNQVANEQSLLALKVNGVDISPDHGYPARVIAPGAVGVNCLKWIDALQFTRSDA